LLADAAKGPLVWRPCPTDGTAGSANEP